jgi:hypothetical protein
VNDVKRTSKWIGAVALMMICSPAMADPPTHPDNPHRDAHPMDPGAAPNWEAPSPPQDPTRHPDNPNRDRHPVDMPAPR